MQPYDTALLRLTHDVCNSLLLRQVEVVVSLDATTVGVRGHRVPGSTGIELGQTELQLAGSLFQYVVDDELVDSAVVALLQRAYGSPDGSLQLTLASVEGHPLRLIVLMRRGRVEVELGGILRIL